MQTMCSWRSCSFVFTATFLLAIGGLVEEPIAQEQKQQIPKTQLEAFSSENGVVVIKGYTEVGTVSGTGKVDVTAMTFKDANTGKETSGIVVEVKSGAAYSTPSRSFIDYDEIAGLLAGMEYVYKIEKGVTKLKNFEATYSTRGQLKVTVFNSRSGTTKSAAIQVGTIGSSEAFIGLDKLAQFAQLIIKAKDILDNPDKIVESQTAPSDSAQVAPVPQPKPKR